MFNADLHTIDKVLWKLLNYKVFNSQDSQVRAENKVHCLTFRTRELVYTFDQS